MPSFEDSKLDTGVLCEECGIVSATNAADAADAACVGDVTLLATLKDALGENESKFIESKSDSMFVGLRAMSVDCRELSVIKASKLSSIVLSSEGMAELTSTLEPEVGTESDVVIGSNFC